MGFPFQPVFTVHIHLSLLAVVCISLIDDHCTDGELTFEDLVLEWE